MFSANENDLPSRKDEMYHDKHKPQTAESCYLLNLNNMVSSERGEKIFTFPDQAHHLVRHSYYQGGVVYSKWNLREQQH